MNRRDVLKGLGLTLGYTVAAPSILSLLHSCKTEPKIWAPQFLSITEGTVLTNLVDLILPKTESSPGALEVNVPEFIDLFVFKVYEDEEKIKFKKGIELIFKALNIVDDNLSVIKKEDYDILLAKYLRSSKEQQKFYGDKHNEDHEDAIIFNTLTNIRNTSVWAYKTSEQVGEHVLAYDPIPGEQIGCTSLENLTNGKAWSI
ncbi:MAG: gluconate 2-dehydrogenase subunit 3 family protein [Algibacter sp.]|uniref:gluconate 2-dehydrogenase subunit 3 family protein n=1 Tax=Algibacter sp. TaxID=1872428 RepID=UPI002635198C|nr:gluconate 2-dehydrogenase subunit 3 family protein [Algibacter sp.]MDG1728413.1 gluconate 2-dehydrogenase subunit 3 family protein [Algibacter sp.]MDG2178099.1 gluconate 2-dehydrogenase subunit 3 family protein [Algibacter sp.]